MSDRALVPNLDHCSRLRSAPALQRTRVPTSGSILHARNRRSARVFPLAFLTLPSVARPILAAPEKRRSVASLSANLARGSGLIPLIFSPSDYLVAFDVKS